MYGDRIFSHSVTSNEIRIARATLDFAPVTSSYARIDLVPNGDELLVIKVEVIESELFLSYSTDTAMRFAKTLHQELRRYR